MSLIQEDLVCLGFVGISAVILMAAAAGAGVLKRLGQAILGRMPKPFLGVGSNREWAEQKRAELEVGQLSPDTPQNLNPSQAITRWRGDKQIEQDAPVAAGGNGHQPPAIEPPSGDVERALLESWLNGSGHNDDAWAEKLLGRKNPT